MFFEYALQLDPGLPEGELRRAGDLFQAIHDACWKIAGFIDAKDHQPWRPLGDPAVRAQIAGTILEMRDLDMAAALEIEKALAMQGW